MRARTRPVQSLAQRNPATSSGSSDVQLHPSTVPQDVAAEPIEYASEPFPDGAMLAA